jgi:GT2 family glycosyltransferase
MYGEDADLCMRARATGARCVVTPEARVIHHAGASERDEGDRTVKVFASRVSLLRKHCGRVEVMLGNLLLICWAGSRLAVHAVLRAVRGESVPAYRRWAAVWRRRADWLAGMREELVVQPRVAR